MFWGLGTTAFSTLGSKALKTAPSPLRLREPLGRLPDLARGRRPAPGSAYAAAFMAAQRILLRPNARWL